MKHTAHTAFLLEVVKPGVWVHCMACCPCKGGPKLSAQGNLMDPHATCETFNEGHIFLLGIQDRWDW